MYDDPTHIRERVTKVYLSQEELAMVDALARYNRRQRSAFIRELLISSVTRHETQITEQRQVS